MEIYRHRVKVGKKMLFFAYNIFLGMGILDHNGSDYTHHPIILAVSSYNRIMSYLIVCYSGWLITLKWPSPNDGLSCLIRYYLI